MTLRMTKRDQPASPKLFLARARGAGNLKSVRVGEIERTVIDAVVIEARTNNDILLGMSFLNRLESWEVRGDKLILRGYP